MSRNTPDSDAPSDSEQQMDEVANTDAAQAQASADVFSETSPEAQAAGDGDDEAAFADDEDGPHLRPLAVEPHQPELPNIDDIDVETLVDPVEAIIFAAGDPVSVNDIKRVLERSWADDHEALRNKKLGMLRDIIKVLKRRWAAHGENRGFGLIEVAEGFTFRSNPRHAGYLRATREERPVRLSRPALETLAIIAYRQPATKPEIDHIRGVDCGGTIRVLLDRNLVRIVGKRDEPGRPMLYGTTREFLSFFNLPSLAQLPSLREFSELTEESQEEVNALGGMPSLDELSRNAKKLRLDEEPAVQALDEAVVDLESTESKTRDAFASQGITIDPAAENPPAEQTPNERETGS